MVRIIRLALLLALPSTCFAWGVFPGQSDSVVAAVPSGTLTEWNVASDTVQKPSGKSAVRTGSGFYTSTNCYSGDCYDNNDVNQRVAIPVVAGDVIDQDEFDMTFYWRANALMDYGYMVTVGVDVNNRFSLHTYSNGRVYSRSALNSTSYNSWVLDQADDVVIDTWYKIRMVYSAAADTFQVYIDDTLELDQSSVTATMTGTVGNVYFCGDENGTSGGDFMIDEVTIE